MKRQAVIIPVPYEKTTSWGKGAKSAPRAIIAAFKHVEDYDIEEDEIIDRSRLKILPPLKNINNFQRLSQEIDKITTKVLGDKKLPVYLGGEHAITAAVVRAIKARRRDFTVLHMDAHLDMRDTYGGDKYSHACVMRRVYQMDVPVVSVGIRSMSCQERQFAEKKDLDIFYAHSMSKGKDVAAEVVKCLGDEFYLSFDVDVMDPSCVRSTGTPEPGGLNWRQTVDFFRALSAAKRRLIGMDMVELAPAKDDRASDFACAKLLYKILTLLM